MTSEDNRFKAGFYIWCLICVFGIAGFIYYINYSDQSRAWRAMLVNFIFWTPLACGMIVWPALIKLSNGVWSKQIERFAFSAIYFGPISIISFIILWTGRAHWTAWRGYETIHQGFWLNSKFVFIRDIIALFIIWILCVLFFSRSRRQASTKIAGWLCFVYAIVFTLISFDMVMALDPKWFSTLFGGYFFVSGMYAALAFWTILSIISGQASAEQRHDLGKLIVALSLLTGYLMYSQLLPIWYEDFEEEIRFFLPRLTITYWRYVSALLVLTVYLGPLVLLLTRSSKRSPGYLMAVAILVLVCLWIERWWEVIPTLNWRLSFGLAEASITAAFLSAFMICVILFNKRELIVKGNNHGN